MPPKAAKPAEEEGGGEGVGLWYVSFSDMITLLLSFFVMLTTFSSFSKEKMAKLEGAWAYIANYSVFPSKNINQESISPTDRQVDWSKHGSEKPPDEFEIASIKNPRESFWLENMDSAYDERKIMYIPSVRLFYVNGTSMVAAGRRHLDLIASFVKMVPCQIVISESSLDTGPAAEQRASERAWSLIEYLSANAGVSRERFSIGATDSQASKELGGQPVMVLTLLAVSVIK